MAIKEFQTDLSSELNLSISLESSVSIDLSRVNLPLISGKTYRFELEENFIRQKEGNRMPLPGNDNFFVYKVPYFSEFSLQALVNANRNIRPTVLFAESDSTALIGTIRPFEETNFAVESQLSGSLRLNPTINASLEATFEQTTLPNITVDLSAILYVKFSDSLTSTVYKPLEGIQDGSYRSNTSNKIFTNARIPDIPEIDQTQEIYTIIITSIEGDVGTANGFSSSGIVETGNISVINAALDSAHYWPTPGYDGLGTVNVNLSRQDGTTLVNEQVDLFRVGDGKIEAVFEFNFTQNWQPNPRIRYYNIMDYLVVGGGGRGGSYFINRASDDFTAGGGGAAGLVEYVTSQPVSQTSYSVVVGAGATTSTGEAPTVGDDGELSSFNGTIAAGGGGGSGGINTTGGQGGTNNDFTSPRIGGFISGGVGGGGGGNGSTSLGQNGSLEIGGQGGNGTTNNIEGSTRTYAAGGGGGGGSQTDDVGPFGDYATVSLTPGSGGAGSSMRSGGVAPSLDGRNGVVIVKIY